MENKVPVRYNNSKDNWTKNQCTDFIKRANEREARNNTGYIWANQTHHKNAIIRLTIDDYLALIEAESDGWAAEFKEKGVTSMKQGKITLAQLGIGVGETLNSPKGNVTVAENNKVKTDDGQIVSLSKAARILSGYTSVSGFGYFSYNGKILSDLRQG